jgi:SAM-dependent methyltransferase
MVIPFDPHRFAVAAADYIVGRPRYAPRLFERIALLCKLESKHRVLDLGCGPGQIAIALAPYVGHVIGIDPEPEMLALAATAAVDAHVDVEWIIGSSYDLGALAERLGRLRLVAMGRSFHWTDRTATLVTLDRIVEPGGAVALLGDEYPDVSTNAWRTAYRAITDRYSARDPAKAMRVGWPSHESILLGSPFRALETIAITEPHRITIDTLLARTRSMSSLASHAAELADEVRTALAPFAAADGSFVEIVTSHALLARRV